MIKITFIKKFNYEIILRSKKTLKSEITHFKMLFDIRTKSYVNVEINIS